MDPQRARPPQLDALHEALDSGAVEQVRILVNALHPGEIADLLEALRSGARGAATSRVSCHVDHQSVRVSGTGSAGERARPGPNHRPCRDRLVAHQKSRRILGRLRSETAQVTLGYGRDHAWAVDREAIRRDAAERRNPHGARPR